MPIPADLIDCVLERSLNDFFAAQGEGIVGGVSERNSCARLAIHMQQRANEAGLSGYFADPEYDRKQSGQIKTILDGQMEEITIVADLILHSRGENVAEDDLVAIEMKKVGRPKREKVADRNRLRICRANPSLTITTTSLSSTRNAFSLRANRLFIGWI